MMHWSEALRVPITPEEDVILEGLAEKPRPAQELDVTTRDRLVAAGLAEFYDAPSPYAKSRGCMLVWIRPTSDGRARLDARAARVES